LRRIDILAHNVSFRVMAIRVVLAEDNYLVR
jgi:hypothetical protein